MLTAMLCFVSMEPAVSQVWNAPRPGALMHTGGNAPHMLIT